MAKRTSASTPATAALTAAEVPFAVHTYAHDPGADSYGMEAAEKLGVDAARVFKTLFVSVDAELVVTILPVDAQLDLKAVAASLGGKRAVMADPRDAERASGSVVGGIAPLGHRGVHRTLLDDSGFAFDTVFVSGGRRGLEVEVAPDDLRRVTAATTARITRGR